MISGIRLSHLVLVFLLGLPIAVSAQDRPLTQRVVQSGHSLTDGILGPLRQMVSSVGNPSVVIDQSTIPGSPMDWRWSHSSKDAQTDARYGISRYDTLVLTERVPLSGTFPWHNSPDEALRWFNNTWTKGKDGQGAETILYATWVSIDSGPHSENPHNDPDGHIPFRERLPREMVQWNAILDYVNENRPSGSPPMRLIPGPLLMAAIYDEIAAGNAPGINHISDLFSDDIHLNGMGTYYIALAHFAVIYDRDPRGIQNLNGVTPEQARWMQELVWRVLSE